MNILRTGLGVIFVKRFPVILMTCNFWQRIIINQILHPYSKGYIHLKYYSFKLSLLFSFFLSALCFHSASLRYVTPTLHCMIPHFTVSPHHKPDTVSQIIISKSWGTTRSPSSILSAWIFPLHLFFLVFLICYMEWRWSLDSRVSICTVWWRMST